MARWPIDSIRAELEKFPPFLTIPMAAELLSVDYFTIHRAILAGDLDAAKFRGRWIIPRTGLLEYLESRHMFNFAEDWLDKRR